MRFSSDGGRGDAYGYGNTTRLFFNVSRSLTNRTYGTNEGTNEVIVCIPSMPSSSSASMISHGGLPNHMLLNPEPHLRPMAPPPSTPAFSEHPRSKRHETTIHVEKIPNRSSSAMSPALVLHPPHPLLLRLLLSQLHLHLNVIVNRRCRPLWSTWATGRGQKRTTMNSLATNSTPDPALHGRQSDNAWDDQPTSAKHVGNGWKIQGQICWLNSSQLLILLYVIVFIHANAVNFHFLGSQFLTS